LWGDARPEPVAAGAPLTSDPPRWLLAYFMIVVVTGRIRPLRFHEEGARCRCGARDSGDVKLLRLLDALRALWRLRLLWLRGR